MDDLVKFKNDFFEVAVKDIIDCVEVSSDKEVPIYGWIYRPVVAEMEHELTPFKFFISNISLVKDGKRYRAVEDTGILFDDFYYYVFWQIEENLNIKDGTYYQDSNYLISDKLTSEKTKISKLNLKKIIDKKRVEYKDFGL